ncbi:MAG: WGR domain-containing protein [Myxococcales bacterium]|nr:WGR domain-containing protein [Myxococcales bacterium]
MSREFEKQENGRTSWWRIQRIGVRYQVTWGDLPGSGQGMTMTCDSEADAEKRVARKIREKLAEGYVEVPSTAVQAPASPRPPRRSVLEAYQATAGRFPVAKVAGTTRSHHVFGGLGFEHYLLVGPTDDRGLLFPVNAASHDPERVRAFLSFLEAHHADVFAVEDVWKVALPAPIGRMTHAVVLAPIVVQLHHKLLRYDQLWQAAVIFDCEFQGDESVGVAEARVRGRSCLPTANWNRDPHPVVDLRTGKRTGKQKPKPFKVFVQGDLSRAVQQTKPTEVLEVRGVYGVAQVSRSDERYELTLPESEPRELTNLADVVRGLEAFVLGPAAPPPIAPSVGASVGATAAPKPTAETITTPSTPRGVTKRATSKLAEVARPDPFLELREAVARKVQEAGGAYGEYVGLAMQLLDPRTPDYFERAAAAQRLWREHRATWLQEWGASGLRALRLHGGLPDVIELGTKELPAALGRVLAEVPVRSLAFRGTALPAMKKVLAMPGRERVRRLTVETAKPSGKGLLDALRKVAWPDLHAFHMGRNFRSQPDETAELFQSMPAIDEVTWSPHWSGPLPFRVWPSFARLRRIAVKNGRFHLRPELCEAAPRLEAIDAAVSVADPSMRMPSVRTLTSAYSEILPCFPNLDSVGLGVNETTAGEIADLPMFGTLRQLQADASTLEHLARHGVLARCHSLVELRTTASPSLPELVALLPNLRVLEVREVYRSYVLDDHLALGILGKLQGPVTRLAFYGGLGLEAVRGMAALPGLEEVCVHSPAFDRACVEALLESPTLRRIEFGRASSGFEAQVASLDSRGRYLGPPVDGGAPTIWSHEP